MDQPSQTILVVEDDHSIRRAIVRMLGTLGYEIMQAANAPEAIRMAESMSPSIDLLVADMLMPGMTGTVLFERLRTRDPFLRVLLISGDLLACDRMGDVLGDRVRFLAKPFSMEAFVGAVAELLALPRPDEQADRPPPAQPREAHPTPPGGVRLLYDANGDAWLVQEVEQVLGGERPRSLVFTSEGIMRRVRNYPPDWHVWSDAALLALADVT